MYLGKGNEDRVLSEEEIRSITAPALAGANLGGKRVLVIIPDATRTAPIPLMFRIFHEYLGESAGALDYLIALGTHRPLSEEAINRLVGVTTEERTGKYAKVKIFNHRWGVPETFVTLGHITAEETDDITGGLMRQGIEVRLNRLVLEYDQLIICGPTFPHELVGFSGGNKYLFPGIGGEAVINFSHWLGGVLTSYQVVGTQYTPVRQVIDRAASFVDRPKLCFSMVLKGEDLAGLYVGSPEDAHRAAADLSARIHIIWVDKPFQRVLAVTPPMYEDLWTAAKAMYKTEPAIADGGELIIYAPHVDEVSFSHGKLIDEIGYHVRDYFLKQWDRFKDYPGAVLAHSSILRGIGEYDAATGVESPRIKVTIASQIPEARCRRLNLGTMDPNQIDLDQWRNREAEGILFVPKAGELLYRVKPA